MPAQIFNAAPMTILQGINDVSTRAPVIVPEELPSHLPLVFIYAKKGPLDGQIAVGDALTQLYGDDTFDERSAYATHGTVLLNELNRQANSSMVFRLKPADAPKPAAVRLSLDVLGPINVPTYKRNSDGSYQLDATTGKPVPTGQSVQGYQVKWVADPIGVDADGNDLFGQGTQIAGDQTDTASATQSKKYPILDWEVSSFGADGNNQAVRLWAPTIKSSTPIDSRILTQLKAYPFRAAFASRADAFSSAKVVPTIAGSQYIDFDFVPGSLFKPTNSQLYAGQAILPPYQDINNPNGNPNTYGPFGRLAVYQSEIDTLVGEFYAAEKPLIDQFSDFTGTGAEQYLFNFVSGVSSQGVPYQSFVFNNADANAVRLTESTNIYALGGGDGTMGEQNYDAAVMAAIADYANPLSNLMDMAKYPQSIFYDSGFTVDTKLKLPQFIANRKDTFLVLGTHDVLGPQLTADQESSLALALKTAVQMYPESDVFGTPAVRGMVVGRSGTFTGSSYGKKLPLTIEVASKAAKYMGAGNGIWKSANNFDRAPGSTVNLFSDINVTFTPATVRNKDWANGLNWVQSSGRRSYFFPALKTVCEDDTSVLNSFFTVLICCDLEKAGEASWREFTGTSSLTNAQLVAGVNDYINQWVLDRGNYDNRVVVQPNTYISAYDEQRGYSWTTQIKVFAPNMKTVATISIESDRLSALQQQQQAA